MGPLKNELVAVIGTGCQMPGARNVDEYWQMLVEGRSAISVVPESRLDRSLYFDKTPGKIGRSYTELGGIVEELPFDSQALPIAEELIKASDPVHLRMLEVCAQALRQAGYDPLKMPELRSGVYIGHSGGSCLPGELGFATYSEQIAELLRNEENFSDLQGPVRERVIKSLTDAIRQQMPHREPGQPKYLGANDISTLVNRAFHLNGPAVAIDAACASSLIAIAQAVVALQEGHIDIAIAGGCSYTKWYGMVLFSQAKSISGTGTRPFDKDADGLISSDGYAAIVMKPLAKALADGDNILGVIRNFVVASDGRGKSLWAPRREGQVGAVTKSYSEEIPASSLQYIECHATSTQVGDATEVTALAEAIGTQLPAGTRLPIGSVKGNVGHTLECAGIAGFLKVLLAFKHGIIPPQSNLQTLNPSIPWNDVPFYVATQPQPWPQPNSQGVRRAAVNAFGIGGLNSHFVLDDRVEPALLAQYTKQAAARSSDSSTDPRHEPIAIVGMGAISSQANNLQEFWTLIQSGKSALSEVPENRWSTALYHRTDKETYRSTSKVGGFMRNYQFDWKKHRVPPKQIAAANPLQFMLIDATDQALEDGGFNKRKFNTIRTSVVVGTMFGGDFSSHMQMGLRLPHLQRELRAALQNEGFDAAKADQITSRFGDYLLEEMPALNDETGSFTSSTLASRLSKTFDLMGGAWAVDSAEVSSMVTLQTAIDLLRTGHSEMVVCAAGQRSMDMTVFEDFSHQNLLATGAVNPPFDKNQSGFVPGEGVGVVLLKRLSDAQRDGDRIRGVIRDTAISFDQMNASNKIADNVRRVIGANSSWGPVAEEVDLIEVVRPQSEAADKAELDGIREVLAQVKDHPTTLASLSSQVGHMLGASGMMSLIKAVLEIEHGVLTPSAGATTPATTVTATGAQFRLANESRPMDNGAMNTPRRAIVANHSSNGTVTHLSVENLAAVEQRQRQPLIAPKKDKAPVVKLQYQVARIGASSIFEMEAKITLFLNKGVQTALTKEFSPTDRFRIGVTGKDDADIRKKLAAAQGKLQDVPRRQVLCDNGLIFGELRSPAAKLAVVFSGQGAQYTGMLKDWADLLPGVRAKIAEIDPILESLNLPSVAKICWDESAQLGTHVLNTQLGVLLGDILAWEVLRELKVRPDVIAGHSYGEFPALIAAGSWGVREALLATLARTTAVDACQFGNAAMLSTTAPADLVRGLLNREHLPSDIACVNAPSQTIIAGLTADLKVLENLLRAAGFASREIRVPRPYHSRLMQAAKPLLAAELKKLPVLTPAVKFVSCGSLRELQTPDDVRFALVEQLTEAVRYQTLVEKLVADNVSLILEAGPKQILTRLNRQIITSDPVLQGCVDARPRDVEEQFLRLKLLLECSGFTEQAAVAVVPQKVPAVAAAVPVPVASPVPTSVRTSALAESRMSQEPSSGKSGRIVWFDATEKRRQKMRDASRSRIAAGKAPAPTEAAPPENRAPEAKISRNTETLPVATPRLPLSVETKTNVAPLENGQHKAQSNGHGNYGHEGYSHNGNGHANGSLNGNGRPEAKIPKEPAAPAVPALPAVPSVDPSLLRDKLEAFVLDFVVEQTGYPPELVDLNSNLEADLGIDSIRKAQLLGEVVEHFSLSQATSIQNMSLDDLPTLGVIVDFFVGVSKNASVAQTAAPVPQQAPVAQASAAPVSASVTVSAPTPQAPAVKTAPQSAVSRQEIARFALNFVIEQTGYPEELVDLQSNLEADLGIDSIRKAQLLGEIAEQFGLTGLAVSANEMSLDDFPTLDSIVDYFASKASSSATAAPSAPAIAEVQRTVIAPAAAPVAPVLPTPATPAPVATGAVSAPSKGLHRADVEKFVTNFVIEQTGYPEELVELNANLEADLGIDSIRKAQLFGEVAEQFGLSSQIAITPEMSLDDYPTLASIVELCMKAGGSAAAPAQAAVIAPLAQAPAAATPAKTPQVAPQPAPLPVALSETVVTNGSALNRRELEEFVIGFVIEQTGYPEELVELNANLEADLGIDSIRKAQLLGEVAERFNVTEVAGMMTTMSLDDFATLTSVVDFFFDLRKEDPDKRNASPLPPDSQPTAAGTEPTAVVPTLIAPAVAVRSTFPIVPEEERMMRRYIQRMVAESLPAAAADARPFAGSVVLLGESATATQLQQTLQSQGSSVRILPASSDWQTVVAQFEQLWNAEPVQHLILLTSDHGGRSADWNVVRDQEVLLPYFVCQKWVQLRVESKAFANQKSQLCAITRMGGDFTLSGRIGAVSGAGLTGLLKGLPREIPGLQVQIIDAPVEEPAKLVVSALLNEVAANTEGAEAGCIRGQRYRLRMVPRPASTLPETKQDLTGAWIITGGARGITARIARGIGLHPGVKLHLLGRSAEADNIPVAYRQLDEQGLAELKKAVMREAAGKGQRPIDAWNSLSRAIDLDKSLAALRDAGLDVTYHACDVSSRSSVAATLDAVRRKHGPIRGIVHGAGIEAAARFERKKADSVLATITTKVDAAQWLWELTRQDKLGWYIGFGSTSGRFGGVGQTDYSMSSDLLCRMCAVYQAQQPDCRVIAVHWPPWAEVGMAARPESKFALEASGLSFLPPQEGVSHLLDEIYAIAREPEVCFVDDVWNISEEERLWDARMVEATKSLRPALKSTAYVEGATHVDEKTVKVEARFDPKSEPVLTDHQLDGVPLVPGVVMLELCCQAAQLNSPGQTIVGVDGFTIQNGARFHSSDARTLYATAAGQPDGSQRCEVTAEFSNLKNQIVEPSRVHAVATVRTTAVPPALGTVNSAVPTSWTPLTAATNPAEMSPTDVGTVYHGPALGALVGVADQTDRQAWFRFDLQQIPAEISKRIDREVSVPVILDAALQACDVLRHRTHGTQQLPSGVGQIRFNTQALRQLKELFAVVTVVNESETHLSFSVDIVDRHRNVVATLREAEFGLRRGGKGASPAIVAPAVSQRPLLQNSQVKIAGDQLTVEATFDPAKEAFLNQHRMKGRPIFPAVFVIELMAECAEQLGGGRLRPVSIRNVKAHSGIQFPGEKPRTLTIRGHRVGQVVSMEVLESPQSSYPSFTGEVVLGTELADLSGHQYRQLDQTEAPIVYEYPKGVILEHGPALHTLKRITAKGEQGWAEVQDSGIDLVSGSPAKSTWIFEPALLDGILVACGTYSWVFGNGRVEIPFGFEEVVFGPLRTRTGPANATFQFRERVEPGTTYNAVLFDRDGSACLKVTGYTGIRVDARTMPANAKK